MKVINITAMWCSACIIMNNIWEKIVKDNDIETISLDYDFDSEEVEKYKVGTVLPVFILLDNDKELRRIIGEHSKEEMLTFLEEK